MPQIIVSSLDAATTACQRYAPGFVISILDKNDPTPQPCSGLAEGRHLALDGTADEATMAPAIIEFARRWAETSDNVLIHCHRGVARSMAIAYILMCVREKDCCEEKIARRLRAAAPHADPNILLVSKADAMLGRDDRMVSAILDLCPCCSTVSAPVVTLPVEA